MADTMQSEAPKTSKTPGAPERRGDSKAAGAKSSDPLIALGEVEEKRESASRAIVHILLGAVLFAGLTAAYLWNANRTHAAQVIIVDTKPLVEMADVNSLRQARDNYKKVLEIKSGNERAIAGLAEVGTLLWIDHGIDDAKAEAQEYVGLANDEDIERGARYAAAALMAYHEGRFDDSVTIAKTVLEKGGVSERLNWTLGLALRAKGELKVGRDNLRKAQDSSSGSPHYALALADAYEEDYDSRNAEHFWAIAANANSNYVPAVARSLITRIRKGEDKKLIATELARLDALPAENLGKADRAAIEMTRSALAYRQGMSKEAAAAADKAIKLAGETSFRLFGRGRALVADGKMKKGLKDLEAARRKTPGALKYCYATARAYSKAGNLKMALSVLNSEKTKLAQDPEFHTTLGDTYAAAADFKKADEAYDRALKINERWPEALLGRGRAMWKQKKYDDATSWLEKAVAARTKFPEVYETIGLMWVEQGAARQADPNLQEAQKIYVARGTDANQMREFYARVIKTLAAHRGGKLISAWADREKAFREGL